MSILSPSFQPRISRSSVGKSRIKSPFSSVCRRIDEKVVISDDSEAMVFNLNSGVVFPYL